MFFLFFSSRNGRWGVVQSQPRSSDAWRICKWPEQAVIGWQWESATFGSCFGSCGNQTRRAAAGKSPIRPYRLHGGLVGLEGNGRPRSKLHGTSGCFLPKAQCKVCASAARNAGLWRARQCPAMENLDEFGLLTHDLRLAICCGGAYCSRRCLLTWMDQGLKHRLGMDIVSPPQHTMK